IVSLAALLVALKALRDGQPRPGQPTPAERIQSLEDRIRDLLYRVWTLEQQAARGAPAAPAPEAATAPEPTPAPEPMATPEPAPAAPPVRRPVAGVRPGGAPARAGGPGPPPAGGPRAGARHASRRRAQPRAADRRALDDVGGRGRYSLWRRVRGEALDREQSDR